MKEFYKSLMKTAEQIDLKILSDKKCCQLLVWLLHFGGGCEDTVFNTKLNTDIGIAQDRLGLYGGQNFSEEQVRLIEILKIYNLDCENYIAGKIPLPEWLSEIKKYYNIKTELK